MKIKSTHQILFVIAMIISLVSMAGCKAQPVKISETDNGKSISVSVGNQLEVSLSGNPTTGYSWEVKSVDATILEQVGEPQFSSDNPNLVGSGGIQTFTFDVKKSGSVTLELIYHRPWETDVEPLQTFSIQVEVK